MTAISGNEKRLPDHSSSHLGTWGSEVTTHYYSDLATRELSGRILSTRSAAT